MSHDEDATAEHVATSVSVSPGAMQSSARLAWSLASFAPRRAGLVIGLSIAMLLTSGVSLLMLVPLLGVTGLDIGEGSIARISEVLAGAFRAVGLDLNVSTVVLIYVGIVVGNALLRYAQTVLSTDLYQAYTRSVRSRVFAAITYVRWASFVRWPSSEFLHSLTLEVERVTGAASRLVSLAVTLVTTAAHLAIAMYVSPYATLLVAALGGMLALVLRKKTSGARAKGETLSEAYQALYGDVSEHLAGLRVTKSHGAEVDLLRRFDRRALDAAQAQVAVARNQADLGLWLHVGAAIIMAGVFSLALLVFEMPVASILLLLYLFARLVPMLTGLQRQFQSLLSLLPALDRVHSLLERLEADSESRAPFTEEESISITLRVCLCFEHVTFGYDGLDGTPVLHDVDLEVRAGRTTAIVGPSGGGKTTVADLAVGLLTPDRGRVLVDGVPLQGGRIAGWRRRLGYVNQDTFLFNDSIRANLLFARADACEAELADVLRSASAGFVMTLPDGLDTVVGDRGVRLSGGERQRIALARAILRRPALLVLDEATSALDPENERVIQDAIARMAGKQTLLVIAHRLASVRGADVIYFMEHGRVVESGGWDELIQRPQGRFRELCIAQGLVDGSQAAIATD